MTQVRDKTIVPSSGKTTTESQSLLIKREFTPLVSLLENPPLPDEHPMSEVDKEAWLNLHSSEERRVAKKFIKNITYISFKSFLERFELSIKSFKEEVKTKPYIIVLPDNYSCKSNYWMASLAMKFLQDTPPTQVLTTSQTKSFLEENQGINHLAVFDDASYSAEQMKEFVYQIRKQTSDQKI